MVIRDWQEAVEVMAMMFDHTHKEMYGRTAPDNIWQEVRDWFHTWFHEEKRGAADYYEVKQWGKEQAEATPIT